MIPKNKSLIKLTSAVDIARQYFPDEPVHNLETIVWGCTGYPCFWPDHKLTAEQNFRSQLQKVHEVGWENVLEDIWDHSYNSHSI